jgi:hypothetical protein
MAEEEDLNAWEDFRVCPCVHYLYRDGDSTLTITIGAVANVGKPSLPVCQRAKVTVKWSLITTRMLWEPRPAFHVLVSMLALRTELL